MVYYFSCFFACHKLGFRGASCVCTDLMIGTQVVVPIHSIAGRSQMWVIHSGGSGQADACGNPQSSPVIKIYHHRHYEHEVQGIPKPKDSILQRRTTLMEFVCPIL